MPACPDSRLQLKARSELASGDLLYWRWRGRHLRDLALRLHLNPPPALDSGILGTAISVIEWTDATSGAKAAGGGDGDPRSAILTRWADSTGPAAAGGGAGGGTRARRRMSPWAGVDEEEEETEFSLSSSRTADARALPAAARDQWRVSGPGRSPYLVLSGGTTSFSGSNQPSPKPPPGAGAAASGRLRSAALPQAALGDSGTWLTLGPGGSISGIRAPTEDSSYFSPVSTDRESWQPADHVLASPNIAVDALEAAKAAELALLLGDLLGARLRVEVIRWTVHQPPTTSQIGGRGAFARGVSGAQPPTAAAEAAGSGDADRRAGAVAAKQPSYELVRMSSQSLDDPEPTSPNVSRSASTVSVDFSWTGSFREDRAAMPAHPPVGLLPLLLTREAKQLEEAMDAKIWYLRWEEQGGAAWNMDGPAESLRAKAWPSPWTRATDAAISTAGVITFFLCVCGHPSACLSALATFPCASRLLLQGRQIRWRGRH